MAIVDERVSGKQAKKFLEPNTDAEKPNADAEESEERVPEKKAKS